MTKIRKRYVVALIITIAAALVYLWFPKNYEECLRKGGSDPLIGKPAIPEAIGNCKLMGIDFKEHRSY